METKLKGIVLSTYEYDDFDKVVTIYSDQMGKVSFYARGVKKVTSKNKYSLDLFSLSEFELFVSSNQRLSKLKTGNLITHRQLLTQNYENYLWAQWVCDLVNQGSADHSKNYYIFELLNSTLEAFTTPTHFLKALAFFCYKILNLYGLRWNLQMCAHCHKTTGIKTISLKDGGFVCRDCCNEQELFWKISAMQHLVTFDRQKVVVNWTSSWSDERDFRFIIKVLFHYIHDSCGAHSTSFYELQKVSLILK